MLTGHNMNMLTGIARFCLVKEWGNSPSFSKALSRFGMPIFAGKG
jgi:hypothetical protein